MPIDVPLWNLVQENKAAVITALLQRFDPSYGSDRSRSISPDGEWSDARFEQWLVRAGIPAWPRLDSGKIEIDGDAFRLMYGAHPAIEGLHALRDSIGVIVRARIPIGRDGRNRPSLFPFGTATGRNAHAKSLFNAHAGDALVHEVSGRQHRGLCSTGEPRRSALPRPVPATKPWPRPTARATSTIRWPYLCGLTDDTDIERWKTRQQRPAPADEGAATRDLVRHGRALAGERP